MENANALTNSMYVTLKAACNNMQNGQPDKHTIQSWVNYASKTIRLIIKATKLSTLNIGEKRQLESLLGHVKRCQLILKNLLYNKKGYGLKEHRGQRVGWVEINSAFKSRIRSGVIINYKHKLLNTFFDDCFKLFDIRVRNEFKKFQCPFKVNVVFCAEFVKQSADSNNVFDEKHFNSPNKLLILSQLDHDGLRQWFIENVIDFVNNRLEKFQEKDSGWALSKIISLAVNINNCDELFHMGSSFIDLPRAIAFKRAIVNVKNIDNACFAHAVVSALHPVKNNNNCVSSYPPYESCLNLNKITFPMTISQISKFESQNDISINVYVLKLKNYQYVTCPVYLTSSKKDTHVNLLMIQENYTNNSEDNDNANHYHFCWIKNLSRLVRAQITKNESKIFICDRCLQCFTSNLKLIAHETDCNRINKCKITLPPKGTMLEFKNFAYKEYLPVVVYSDFECLLQPVTDTSKLATLKYQKHEPYSVAYYVHCRFHDHLSFFNSYRGPDCRTWFANELEKLLVKFQSYFDNIVPMEPLTPLQTTEFYKNNICHICEKPILNEPGVRDHVHHTGKYRGKAHNACNLNYDRSKYIIPVIFHNFTGYDSHFILKDLVNAFPGKFSLLPLNKERYISFTKERDGSRLKLRFIDSYRFLNASLDKLVSYLTKEQFKILHALNPQLSDSQKLLLTRKGVFPYEYIDSWEKLNETQLPKKELFFSQLKNSHISDLEYTHAQNVWTSFKINDLGSYSDLYLKTDVLLLADVFENFRTGCRDSYGLDPAHYYTTPGYTWDAMLKYTKIQLELLSDIDMLLFVERGIRGGVSQCSTRHSVANNKFLPNYNKNLPSTYLMYFDVNNLYGWAMSQYLPCGGFQWLSQTEINDLNILDIDDQSSIGYLFEVDLEYPEHLHNLHQYLPFAPEHRVPPNSKYPKLLTTLYNKEKYVLHYQNLKQCLQANLTLKKIHRVLRFRQKPFLKSYIDLNTSKRQNAKNEFEKHFYKLLNNAVYGKCMENVRKHRKVNLVTKWDGRFGALYYLNKPNFHSRSIFDENLMAVELNKLEITFNKPLYVGMCILDISKICLYNFHYNYMLSKFSTNECKLLYTDTDSLVYSIVCDNFYNNLKEDISLFDTSDYNSNNIFGIPLANKKLPGLMKDENNGCIMTEFVGLRSKMYSFTTEGGGLVKKAKGVSESVVKQRISFNDYLKCLKTKIILTASQYQIRSQLHSVFSMKQIKIALSANDDKRYILPNGVDTLPWGHCAITFGNCESGRSTST